MNSHWLPIKRSDLFTLALIVSLAAFARLWNIGVVEYRYDEAVLSGLAFDVLAGKPPSMGLPASIGIPLPPTMAYFLAVPYSFTSDPTLVTICIALFNVIGCVLLWVLCRRYLMPGAALWAGLIYAVTPWALLYSRKIWVPCLHTPFLLAGLLLGFLGFRDNKRWAQALCLPVLSLTAHFHYIAFALVPLYLWLLWSGRKQIDWRMIGLSIILSLTLLIPFASALPEFATSVRDFLQANGSSSRSFSLDLSGFEFLAKYATGAGLDTKLALDEAAALRDATGWTPLPGGVLGALMLAGIPLIVTRYRKIAIFVLLWVFLTALLLSPGLVEIHDHYLTLSLPALCILAGVTVESVARLKVSGFAFGRWVALGGVSIVLLAQFGWWANLLNYLDRTLVPNFGTPLHYIESVREELASAGDVLIFNADLRDSAWTWEPVLRDRAACVREVIIPEGGIFVRPRAAFAAFVPTAIRDYALLDLYENDHPVVISRREGEAPYTIYHHQTIPEWATQMTVLAPVAFDNGVTLTGYKLTDERAYLTWALSQSKSEYDYKYFVHYYDAGGERIFQRDTSFYTGRYWCAGDHLTTWIDAPVPENTSFMRVGMYRLTEGAIIGSSVIDENGQAISPWVDVALEGDQA